MKKEIFLSGRRLEIHPLFLGGRFFQLPARRIAARIFSPEKRFGKKIEQSSFVDIFLRQLDKTFYGRVLNCAIIFYALVFLVPATAKAAQRPFRHEGKASGKEENPLLPQSSSAARAADKAYTEEAIPFIVAQGERRKKGLLGTRGEPQIGRGFDIIFLKKIYREKLKHIFKKQAS